MKATFNWRYLGPIFVIIGACLWGTETYFRVSLNNNFDSDILVFVEHLFCLSASVPILIFAQQKWRHYSARAWFYVIFSGALGSAIGTFFFTESLRFLNTSVANILLNFQPIISVLFASLLLHEKLGRRFFFWACVAIVCGFLLVLGNTPLVEFKWNIGLLFVAITVLSWGFSTVAGRGTMLEIPLTIAVFLRFLFGTLTLFLLLLIKGKLHAIDPSAVATHLKEFMSLSVVCGVFPIYFYFKGLSKTSASVGGFCEMTQTLAALLVTWGLLGDRLSFVQCFAGLCLLVAIYQINSAEVQT